MITAFGTEEVKRQAEEAGLDGFLAKPVQPSMLLDTIMDVFAKERPGMSEAAQAKAREAKEADHIGGARILVAEDNEINQQVAREILDCAGAIVEIAWNGTEALEAVNVSQFDAVLMDIQMPEMDGYEATRVIRADERFKNLPIIAMTAHAMAGDREKSLHSGMNDHIAKPINADDLLGILEKWIGTPTGDQKEPQTPAEPLDLSAVEPLICNLHELLEHKNLGATRIAQELAEAVRGLQYSEKARLLMSQVSSLEYENARETLILLAKELGVPVAGRKHGQ